MQRISCLGIHNSFCEYQDNLSFALLGIHKMNCVRLHLINVDESKCITVSCDMLVIV